MDSDKRQKVHAARSTVPSAISAPKKTCDVPILAIVLLTQEPTMPLIIRDQLVNPPSWFASFRDLTLYCSVFLRLEILLESDDVDTYYRWVKSRGGMDFVEDFVRPGEEDGLHLDIEP